MDTGSGRAASAWLADDELMRFGPLPHRELHADVCVIGAGIAGLSVAYHLTLEGRTVVVLEDGAIGGGETSRTTAHLSNAFDNRYYAVERLHGTEAARLTADSHTAAIHDIEAILETEDIECGFEWLDGYLFTPPGDPQDPLEREYEACQRAGLTEVEWVECAPLPKFETGRCLRFPGQAQFHPLRYLEGLAEAIVRRGGRIFTDTHVTAVEGGKDGQMGRVTVGDDGTVVVASDIVVATNTPINDMLTLHTKQFPYRTYVLAARTAAESGPEALFWDTADPYHYARYARLGMHRYLLVGGEDHRTGQADDGEERFARLENWARERFPGMGDVEYAWSGQVMEPVDALAYIGLNPGDENVWVVTGDSGNGMTHGAIAGMLIADLIEGRENPWARLYDPGRKSLRAALEYTKENLNMAAQYASWMTGGDVAEESEIPRGGGAVVREGLHKCAVYRDMRGDTHRLSAVCPHLGAIVTWNAEEKTWDCPAHGSRFDATGRVVNGPANADLPKAEPAAEAGRTGESKHR